MSQSQGPSAIVEQQSDNTLAKRNPEMPVLLPKPKRKLLS